LVASKTFGSTGLDGLVFHVQKSVHTHISNRIKENSMTTQLTPTQQIILNHARGHPEGKISWFPDNIKGGARQKVLDSLLKQGLIRTDGTGFFVSDTCHQDLAIDKSAANTPREHSKQAEVIAMLKRPEGATLSQVCEATGWQQHTVRGMFSGTLKKRLGLAVTSSKTAGERKVYRIGEPGSC
jgi:hypothetical protein